MFTQAKQNRVFEDVFVQIEDAILQGQLKEGDKLPGERKLREIFKVSRGTLREALRALEQKGLITIKTGVQGGVIVSPVNNKLMRESLDLLLRYQKISLPELAEFREAVEGFIAARAAKKATKKDVKKLTTLAESINTILSASELRWSEFIAADSEFHLLLARIAGNRVFGSVLQTVHENINQYFDQFLPRERPVLKKNYQDLSEITKAIGKRDSNKAQILVQGHVRRFNRMMEKGEQTAKPKG